ncbi:CCA tRNA nucleotidyltransferase [Sulfurihydrogenibium sp.]|uniref:CCA tRNA nucleotidyltransferase n=1 Tax=Sulfurihydrogenibium sp. TaxID=2053621 RepID=UPI002630A7C3|nr:CCA tRNA nucleotidyltransferase [Sulfurihydrogenibium sp.]
MLGIERLLEKIFSKKKEEELNLDIKENYVHGLLFYNSYFDTLAKALPRGSFCFIVGGWVRDRLINRPLGKNIDIDFIVTAPPMEVARNLKKYINGSIFQFEKEKTVATFIFQEDDYNYRFDFSYLDISDILSSDLPYEEKEKKILDRLIADLMARDFTINAIAVNFDDTSGLSASHTTLIDPSNGFKDLQEGLVKPISIQNIINDPVRILRGYRLALELEFTLDKEFEKFVKKNPDLIEKSPKERVRDELLKIISNDNSYNTLEKLKENKLLSKIVSENLKDLSIYKDTEELLKKNLIS